MPSQLIDFGAMAYPTVKSDRQLNENLAGKIVDGYINELKQYVKRPGLTTFLTQGSASWDALYITRSLSTNYALGVTNGTFYKINANATVTALTGITVTAGTPAVFTEDGTNAFAVSNSRIVKFDLSGNTSAFITGGNSPTGATFIAYLDGFLVCNGEIGGGGVPGDLNFSDDKDNNYAASDSWEVFNNEALGDSCTAIAVQWQEIFCFGPESMEASYNDGDSPFARIDGAINPFGILAAYSLLNIDNTLYFLGKVDGAVRLMRLEGRRPVVASESYDKLLNTITNPETGRAFAYVDDGKPFYCISFEDDITLAFNLRTRQWSQFAKWSGTTATGTLTSNATAPGNGDTVTIGSYTYTFRTTLTTPSVAGEVLIGSSAAVALDNVKAAINGSAGAGTTYAEGTLANDQAIATTNTDTTQLVVARWSGVFGNSIGTTESSSNLSWGATTLTGGTDVYDAFIGIVSAYWQEEQKFLIGDRRANGKLYYISGGTDAGDTIRMELTSNVHGKGSLHHKYAGALIFSSDGGEYRVRFREVGDTWEEFFMTITEGYSQINSLGEYIRRQYQVVHEDTGQLVLLSAEEWWETGAF